MSGLFFVSDAICIGQRSSLWFGMATQQPMKYEKVSYFDAVLDCLKKDMDLSALDRNLRMTTEERAQKLVNATRFIAQFRPLVSKNRK
jgi:hypothetical protein